MAVNETTIVVLFIGTWILLMLIGIVLGGINAGIKRILEKLGD